MFINFKNLNLIFKIKKNLLKFVNFHKFIKFNQISTLN